MSTVDGLDRWAPLAPLRDEVIEYVRALPVSCPEEFPGDTVTLYRTRSDDWTGRWWRTLTWEHVHTWRLR